MSNGFYNPFLTEKTRAILAAVQAVATTLQKQEDPTVEQLRHVAVLIEEASGTPDLDPRNPEVNGMLTAWNQILLGCLLKQCHPKPYTDLIDRVYRPVEETTDADPPD